MDYTLKCHFFCSKAYWEEIDSDTKNNLCMKSILLVIKMIIVISDILIIIKILFYFVCLLSIS